MGTLLCHTLFVLILDYEMYETLERKNEELLLKLEKQSNIKFSLEVLTYLYILKPLDRLELETTKVWLCLSLGKTENQTFSHTPAQPNHLFAGNGNELM